MKRIVIVGGPRTGKTTHANALGEALEIPVLHGDDLIALGWSEASEHVASKILGQPSPWVFEGCVAARGLRKWLKNNATGRPCDLVSLLWYPRELLSPGQATMTKGVRTVYDEISHELVARGVELFEGAWRPCP